MSCTENLGNKVEQGIGGVFEKIGKYVGVNPKKTILYSIVITAICGVGFMRFKTENRQVKLWVPQNTPAEIETEKYESYFQSDSRLNVVLFEASNAGANVITKDTLVDAMKVHTQIATGVATVEDKKYTFTDLCTTAGGVCADPSAFSTPICQCLVQGVLGVWNFDLETIENDADVFATLNGYYNKQELMALLGSPVFDSSDSLVSAEAIAMNYFIDDRSAEAGSEENANEADPISEGWELDVFINATEAVSTDYDSLSVSYLAGRSFGDEFGGAITGDLMLVQISYIIVFVFLAFNLGNIKPGPGSRQTLSLAALFLVILSTGASFGVSAGSGLFFGPVHSLLPFILIGIGVDDAFVIVNAFNRERKEARSSESNEDISTRAARAMKRAGASITVTSLTDMVAFGISASSRLPALASFCAYAAVGVIFLWAFSCTFFAAALVLDERRQRDNRREFLCCLTRKNSVPEGKDAKFEEDKVSKYFRQFHAPAILSKIGKLVVLLLFSVLLGFGVYGATNLSVENTERSFFPSGSYITTFLNSVDKYYPSSGTEVFIVFENGSDIYASKEFIAQLDTELSDLSETKPYISEPITGTTYRNVIAGLSSYLGGNWPATEEEFDTSVKDFIQSNDGAQYSQDVEFKDSKINAIRVSTKLVALTKEKRNGDKIDDADKQIESMDAYRELVKSWGNSVPEGTFLYSSRFIGVETFKIIQKELFLNVGLALAAVAAIVLVTVANFTTSALITLNVAACIVEILGAMYYIGIAIDSVSVINIVLAVGLSIDYSAHVGHCFMTKPGEDRNSRVLEALTDIGAAVLSGASTTFLAVVVLLFSNSYVFQILSKQFALTVALGVLHGLVLLPVLLSLVGPKPFQSADAEAVSSDDDDSLSIEEGGKK